MALNVITCIDIGDAVIKVNETTEIVLKVQDHKGVMVEIEQQIYGMDVMVL